MSRSGFDIYVLSCGDDMANSAATFQAACLGVSASVILFTCTKGFERGRILPTYPPDVQTAGRKIITYVPLPPILVQSYLIPDKT